MADLLGERVRKRREAIICCRREAVHAGSYGFAGRFVPWGF